MRRSFAVRTFSVVMIVIASLTVVAAIDLISARNVGQRIYRITNRYVEIYGAVARVNVYSTEQAYRTRHYIVEKTLDLQDKGGDRDSTIARLRELDGKVGDNLRDARGLLQMELDSSDPLIPRYRLTGIAERLGQIAINEHSHLERQIKIIQALDRGDTTTFRASFGDLVRWRATYDNYIDATRLMVFEATQDTGAQVGNYQKSWAFISVGLLALAGALTAIMAFFLSRVMVSRSE